MKIIYCFVFISSLFCLSGCFYEVPLSVEQKIPIDESILGVWETIPTADKEEKGKFMILKYSNTEYLILNSMEGEGSYFRGYPIKIKNKIYIQIQIIGTAKGNFDLTEKRLFTVISYQLSNNELKFSLLNDTLINPDIKNKKFFKKEFLKHINDKDLFLEFGKAKKVDLNTSPSMTNFHFKKKIKNE